MAYDGDGEYLPGEWCTFCKVSVKCRARAEEKMKLARLEFKMPPLLTDAEIEEVLDVLPDLTKWANEITAYATEAAIHHGKEWNGFKVVEGRSNRKYRDELLVAEAAREHGYTDIYRQTLIPMTEMQKLMGKSAFEEILGDLIYKPPAQANAAVLLAVLKPGDTFLGLNLAHGGHLSHGSAVNTSGILYHAIGYDLDQETGRVNYDQMEQLALEHKPKLIIGGGSAYSREWDYKRMREIADKVGALLMIDMAHPAGLIAAGLLDNPVKYAHIVTSTTHKTLRGPRGGIILMGKDFENPWGLKTPKGVTKMMSQLLNSAVFPGQQGGPLEHVIAAKAVAFGEALQPEFKEWAKQVKKNASVLADELIKRGFTIVSGGTDNHSMLVDLRSKYPDLTGKVAENALVAADITVNKNMVPYDTRSAFQTSGIRLGTPAITTRGAKEDLMVLIAELIEEVLNDPENEEVIARVRAKVNETMKDYPLFAY